MEQEYLFISKKHTELFSIKSDVIDETMFENNLFTNIKYIIKNNNIDGKFKLVNLYNGVEKKYRTDNLIQIGGVNNDIDFGSSWTKLSNFIYNNIENKIDSSNLNELYNKFILDGGDYGINKDELNNMFLSLLESIKYNQDGGEQTIDQTNQLISLQTVDQTNQPTNQLTNLQTVDQTNQPTNLQTVDQTNQLPNLQTIDQTNQPTNLQTVDQTNQLPNLQTIDRTSQIDISKDINKKIDDNMVSILPIVNISAENIGKKYDCPVM